MSLERFLPVVRQWFAETLGEPTDPQRHGWPLIGGGRNVLIAAPTGTGKTLSAFLWALDRLLARGEDLDERTRILYVSPLKALGNDVSKNLKSPLAALRERDPSLPEVRVAVRSGDTPSSERAAMKRKPPHVLVTTPESLYILLTSKGGRAMLAGVETVIVDEIHAMVGDKRGAHLALSLERLEHLAGPVQRIGLSATQKPIDEVARFLVGTERECEIVDVGHRRELDLGIELPASPLAAVCSHEVWDEIYDRMVELIESHRTTLVFTNTRKLAERLSARLATRLGEDRVGCHHSSLSRERRFDAEQRLKSGELSALVATASLELGIDIGDVDLVIQTGSVRRIATFLQRVGRAGHAVGRVPKGRMFPLTRDELGEALALFRAVDAGELDAIEIPKAPLEVLAQQVVATACDDTWDEDELFSLVRRAWPYRDLEAEDFERVLALHAEGRLSLLHRDGVNGRVRGTRRARLTAVTSGGTIPDNADYKVVQDPDGTHVGSINEDFAIEASVGDVFQLGNTSWQILKVESGTVRVADAKGAPPTLPFWFGEAPARSRELGASLSALRDGFTGAEDLRGPDVSDDAATRYAEYLAEGLRVLGVIPTEKRLVLERFFDESGGMQMVLHAPLGARINRALGLALRKRFCRGFGFELQAAATEDAIVISLGPMHSFPLEEVFDYLHPNSARHVLTQAMLPTPLFQTRWRWNAMRSLQLERMRGGKKVPPPLQRMRAEDLLAQAFPQALACPETLAAPDLPVPMDHPIVRQTVDDCLEEAMDVEGFLEVLQGLRDGTIERHAVDVSEPSVFCHGILSAQPYSFLDDAPLEERRTQAVLTRRVLDPKTSDELGALDPDAVVRVKAEAWPDPRDAEEVHEALLWMGYVTVEEASPWRAWLDALAAEGRVQREADRWYATEAPREPKAVLRGRLEALGPIVSDDPILIELEREGGVLRVRFDGRQGWCDRRLLARIHRYTLERLRAAIEPVSPSACLRHLAEWQHLAPDRQAEGPAGLQEVLEQLAGFEAPAVAWEKSLLPARVRGFQRRWLDELTLSGQVAWGRLWGSGAAAIRSTPLAFVPRVDLDHWLGLTPAVDDSELGGDARAVLELLRSRGASFTADLQRGAHLLPSQLEEALGELVAAGLLTGDGFAGLRSLLAPASRRRHRVTTPGRWSLFRGAEVEAPTTEFVARCLLRRYGVVFRKLLQRERLPVPWRSLLFTFRELELKGEVRGGRFVSGFSGEQFALPEAVTALRAHRDAPQAAPLIVSAADPLNLLGILTPDAVVPSSARRSVTVVE